MSTGELITAVLVFIIAGILFLLSIRHLMERGFLLNNTYIYASKEERRTMNKKPYYKQSGIVFCLLGLIFTVIGLSVVLQNNRLLLLEAVLAAGTILYAVISTGKISRNKQSERN